MHVFFCCILTVLPNGSSGVQAGSRASLGLHPRDLACERGQRRLLLGGLGGKLMVESERLDGEGRGSLVLPVADHC